jgi:glycosyltransferase involved in cell wall biosynthesis
MVVDELLKYDGNDIEVIVVDNHSTDNTTDLLREIEDTRLKIIENDKNYGGMGNYRESLLYANGSYSFVQLSRDSIDHTKIPDLLKFLSENDFAILYCGEDIADKANKQFIKGDSAFIEFAYRGYHQTGHIYKTELIKSIISKYKSDEVFDLFRYFPHDFWNAEMTLLGGFCRYNKKIRIRVSSDYMKKAKSQIFEEKSDLWFFPTERIQQFNLYIKHMKTLNIKQTAFARVFVMRYLYQLYSATVGYKVRMADENTCGHYNIHTKNISFREMIHTGKIMKVNVLQLCEEINYKIPVTTKVIISLSVLEIIGFSFAKYCKDIKSRAMKK